MSKWYLDDLRRSGLTPADAKLLRIAPLTPEETHNHFGRRIESYCIPYFDLNGKLHTLARYRMREGEPKYLQVHGTQIDFYLAPYQSWRAVAEDKAKPLAFTEGEKKAAIATKLGFPTIGLGGVWAWRAKARGEAALPAFDRFNWVDRAVLLIFDSDLLAKPDVQLALNALAGEVLRRGARPEAVLLPPQADQSKTGLDDYLLDHSLDDLVKLPRKKFDLTVELWSLNEDYAVLDSPPRILRICDSAMLTVADFTRLAAADRKIRQASLQGVKEVSAAKLWLEWPSRRRHIKLEYTPGGQRILPDSSYNTWTGWGADSKVGDLKPWLALLDHVFADTTLAQRTWFEQWLAYPIQHPGVKLYTAVVLWGVSAAGKSLLGLIIGDVYGRANFSEIGETQLHASFNAWAAHRQFILADEVSASDRRVDADLLKSLITREQIEVNVKYQPTYFLTDRCNYLFTSNHPDPVFVEPDDRRFFIHHVPNKLPLTLAAQLDADRKSGALASKVRSWLERIDLSGFNPTAQAPITAAKAAMIDATSSDLERWTRDVINDPMAMLSLDGRPNERELWTLAELITVYDIDDRKRVTERAMGNALRRAGAIAFGQVRVSATKTVRLWAIARTEFWSAAEPGAAAAAYEAASQAPPKPPPKFTKITGGKT